MENFNRFVWDCDHLNYKIVTSMSMGIPHKDIETKWFLLECNDCGLTCLEKKVYHEKLSVSESQRLV